MFDTSEKRARQSQCPHARMIEDRFSKLPGVRRLEPGDVCCADCGLPLPLVWNGGKPEAIEESSPDIL